LKKTQEHITDEELLRRYFSDADPQWLGLVLERYTGLLFGVAMKYLKDEDMAKDIVQTVFLKALSEIPKKEIKNIGAWLYQVAKNECFNQFRMQKSMVDEEVLEQIKQPEEVAFSKLLLEDKKSAVLLEALEQIKTEQKISISMFYFEKKSYQQISESLKIDIKQVKSNIQNGKRNLKIILMESTPNLFKKDDHD